MDTNVQSIVLTILTAGGGGAVVAFAVFKALAAGWLEAQFSKQLEAFRHDKAKELEHLRAEIDGALRARIRLQERQFEAMLSVWEALKSAQEKLLISISPLQQYSDLSRMDQAAREEYLQSFDLQVWQMREILASSDVQKSFSRMVDRKRFAEAATAFSELDRETRSKELFFETDTFELVRSVCDKIHGSLISREMAIDEPAERSFRREAWNECDKECVPLIKKLVSEFREKMAN